MYQLFFSFFFYWFSKNSTRSFILEIRTGNFSKSVTLWTPLQRSFILEIRTGNFSKSVTQWTPLHKWKKQNSWNHLKNPNGGLPASIRWKNTPSNHKSYRLLSATNEGTTTVKAIRAQSKNKCANDKQMESQTNLNYNTLTNSLTRLPSGKTKAADW